MNRIVTQEAAAPTHYTAVRFEYDRAQRVAFMLGEAWDADGPDGDSCPDNYTVTWAREFRYDGGRARYLNRQLDPAGIMQTPPQFVGLSETWTDYDADASYGDFEIDPGTPPTIDNLRSFEPGVALKDPDDQSTGVKYAHSDPLGTQRLQTNSSGGLHATFTYTAFGERVDSRSYASYGYAGAWGYQAHDFPSSQYGGPVAFLHVGFRYYDPSTGRFLQRDPVAISGGLNVYDYVSGRASAHVDPAGLHDPEIGTVWGAASVAMAMALGCTAMGPLGLVFVIGYAAGSYEKGDAARIGEFASRIPVRNRHPVYRWSDFPPGSHRPETLCCRCGTPGCRGHHGGY